MRGGRGQPWGSLGRPSNRLRSESFSNCVFSVFSRGRGFLRALSQQRQMSSSSGGTASPLPLDADALRRRSAAEPAAGAPSPPPRSAAHSAWFVAAQWEPLRGAALCSASFSAILALAAGLLLVIVGAQNGGSACAVPLARYAVVDGSLSLAVGAALIASAVLGAGAPQLASLRGAWLIMTSAATAALVLVLLGVRIWGTVLAFGDGLWARMADAAAAGTPPPCEPALYAPVAILLLVVWSLAAFFIALACCAVCCLALGAGLFYLCCGLAERNRRRWREEEDGGENGDARRSRGQEGEGEPMLRGGAVQPPPPPEWA